MPGTGSPSIAVCARVRLVGNLRADVDHLGDRFDHVQVLGEALPAPGDSGRQRRPRDVLHTLHQSDQPFMAFRVNRGKTHAAVPHDHGGHSMPARRRKSWIPSGLTVVVGMNIHKSRSDQQAIGVDGASGANKAAAHFHHSAGGDPDISYNGRRTGTVHHSPAPDQQIEHFDFPWVEPRARTPNGVPDMRMIRLREPCSRGRGLADVALLRSVQPDRSCRLSRRTISWATVAMCWSSSECTCPKASPRPPTKV